MKKKIYVTGMGIQCAIGNSIHEFTSALQEGQCGIDFISSSAELTTVKIGAKLKSFSFLEQLSNVSTQMLTHVKQIGLRASLPMQVSILTALQAWHDANLHQAPLPSHRVGIVVSCDNTSQQFHYDTLVKFLDSPEYVSPRYALQALETDHIGTLSELFSIHGEGFTVGGASASGNVAIIKAAQLIKLGIVDACMVVGSMSELSPLALQAYRNIGAMGGKKFENEPDKACRPFDSLHEGFIYGEGCGCLIFESEDSVRQRKVHAKAEYVGGVLRLDGNRLSDPNEEGEAVVMKQCIEDAGLTLDKIDYINAHGSSSPLGDITEIKAIKAVFGSNLNKPWINATKGLTGHCLFSAGVIEAIACIVQMRHHFIHPNKNLENPIDHSYRFAGQFSVNEAINYSLSNSFGFGGINTAIILKKVD